MSTTAQLPVAPLELGGEDLEESFLEADEFGGIFGFDATHAIAILKRHSDLAVEAEVGLFLSSHHLDFNQHRVAHDHGAMRQSVGRDRSDDEGLNVGLEDGAARAQRIAL